jgi:hypothetical protein
LEEGNRSKYIHELRANAGRAVLSELKGLLERKHLEIIRENIPWCSDLLTYIILVLKAAFDLGDSIHGADTEEIKADVQKLQQALCFFMQDLGSALFGQHSPFLTEFRLTRDGVSMRETIWEVLAEEKSYTIARSQTSSLRTKSKFELFKDSLSGLNDAQYYAVIAAELRTHLDDPLVASSERSSSKMQRTTSGSKRAKSPSRKAKIQASLEVIFHACLPFRHKKTVVVDSSTNASPEDEIDPISQYALSISGHSVRGDSILVVCTPTQIFRQLHANGSSPSVTILMTLPLWWSKPVTHFTAASPKPAMSLHSSRPTCSAPSAGDLMLSTREALFLSVKSQFYHFDNIPVIYQSEIIQLGYRG